MMIFQGSLLVDLLEVLLAVVVVIIGYFKWNHQYWKRKNVPYIEPTIPFGNLPVPFVDKTPLGLHMKNLYNEIKSRGVKHAGIYFFATHLYYPVDLDYLKNILTKDFQYFTDRGTIVNEKEDPLSAHLFSLGGTKWRNLRTKLSPTFTSGKLKAMFQTLVDCQDPLYESMEGYCKNHEPIDIKDVFGCFTTDIIGSCAFGLECNSFKDKQSPFRVMGKKVFKTTTFRRLKMSFATNFPSIARALKLKLTRQEISDFFIKVVSDTVNYRQNNHVVRKDFLQLLIDLKNTDGHGLTMNEMAAQSFLFFLAGFETSSTTSTFTLYELACHQDIQQKVRDEINEVLKKHDGKITYDSIQDMKYMNQVIDEALRKYPPVPFVTRQCVKDYKLPDSDLVIEKDTRVIIPIYGIQHDPEYYPDPEKFDPERFSEDNKSKRHQYAHIPFGEGPRICIGMRFGLMQTKVGLASILKNFKLTVNKKTQQPLKMALNSFILAAEGDVWLDLEKI